MRFASAISTAVEAEASVEELLEVIEARLTAGMVDLAFLFSSAHFEDDLERVVERLTTRLPHAVIVGCTAGGTLGDSMELEGVPSMSLLAGSLPGVDLRPFHINQAQLDGAKAISDWERLVGVSPESGPVFLALADPFKFNVADFVDRLNGMYPGAPLVGGVASAGTEPDQNRLIIEGRVVREGVVGLALTGRLIVETVVSQGCRPIGKPFVITKGERNVVFELGGRSALRQLHDVLVGLTGRDEKLARQSLFVGRMIDEHQSDLTRGGFLIQNIIGVDRKSGALGIAGQARVGSTVRFHVRDAESADEDLRAMLSPLVGTDVRGALMFNCNGRGTNMWPAPNHDIDLLRELLGDVPVAGFFCSGEFGPVGGTNFIHGFTASIALIREPVADGEAEQTSGDSSVSGAD
ncbi:MAG: FIST C-terminal domain-containing protein [Planctomycetes bacterium]|nr:FIST C-terminal domain-containing protein [Planctomycetota bacterium]